MLAKRQIPMIYDEGINSTGIEFEGIIQNQLFRWAINRKEKCP